MANACRCCIHKQRNMIEKEIVNSIPHAQIARKFNVGMFSVRGHAKNHLPKTLVKNEAVREMLHDDNLLADIKELVEKTKAILKKSEKKDRPMIALAAIRELRSTYKFLCELAVHLYDGQKNEDGDGEEIRKQIDRLGKLSDKELSLLDKLLGKLVSEDVETIDVKPVRECSLKNQKALEEILRADRKLKARIKRN